jgi:hypothetical protein
MNTTTENTVEYPDIISAGVRLTRAQASKLANERHAWTIAARLGAVTEDRMDAARAAVRAVVRAGRLSYRLMEAENESENFLPDGSECAYLANLRQRSDKADKAAMDALAPFALRLMWPGPYPIIEATDGRAASIFLEY